MNSDRIANSGALVRAGHRPWQPSDAARDVEVWEKPDLPVSGTFRHGDTLVLFALIATAGAGSLWGYVPVPAEREDEVISSVFDSDEALDAFIEGCFAGQKAVFATARDLVLDSRSDGTLIGHEPSALLAAAARWLISCAVALGAASPQRADASPEELLFTAQEVLAGCGHGRH